MRDSSMKIWLKKYEPWIILIIMVFMFAGLFFVLGYIRGLTDCTYDACYAYVSASCNQTFEVLI